MKLVAGDLGGTKTLLCIADCSTAKPRIIREQRFITAEWPSLTAMLRAFLRDTPSAEIGALCVVVAGPVQHRADGRQQAKITNIPWQLDSRTLQADLSLPQVLLLNDFQGIAHGLAALEAEDTAVLHQGTPRSDGPRAVIGAGTGLGIAILAPHGQHYTVLPTEGGHSGFAPEDVQQAALWAWLREKTGKRPTWEDLLSGSGLQRIYTFLRDTGDMKPSPALTTALEQEEDAAATISRFALSGRDPLADAALTLFVRLYGSQAGNLALSCLPGGGLFVAGGIAPKIRERMEQGEFMAAFLAKDPMRHVLASIPVHLVLNERVGLLGAFLAGCQLMEQEQAGMG